MPDRKGKGKAIAPTSPLSGPSGPRNPMFRNRTLNNRSKSPLPRFCPGNLADIPDLELPPPQVDPSRPVPLGHRRRQSTVYRDASTHCDITGNPGSATAATGHSTAVAGSSSSKANRSPFKANRSPSKARPSPSKAAPSPSKAPLSPPGAPPYHPPPNPP
ncbi:hypothetical protein M011DRAFT_486364 [Sporormia fimetaria CBS 119925]|uniref:Uncharacterized protein n=1 Tax=Sporormia fimetaria CBS 119925 TaxID=1340428 RepID=A0A6A6VA55_9PLEO|nr:hypothetical protein M011DRAFT_486364 [Sporormia fimetaria CBS 119925]